MGVGDWVQARVAPPAGWIVLNRPDKRNALTRLMLLQLRQALEDMRLERRVRATILTGAGTAFCGGEDLEQIRAAGEAADAQQQWREDAVSLKELVLTMLRHPKPIIAGLNGPAAGAGATLALASDLVVAAADASLGFPEARRGLVAGLAAPLLVFRAGAAAAARLLLTAELADAEEAQRLGLVHEVTPREQLEARAAHWAEQCARSAPEALQLTKRMLNETVGERLETLLSVGAAASAASRTTEAAEEGLTAFLEKRQPQWP